MIQPKTKRMKLINHATHFLFCLMRFMVVVLNSVWLMRSAFCEKACFDNSFDCVCRDSVRVKSVLFASAMIVCQWSVMWSLWSFSSNGYALRRSLLQTVYSVWCAVCSKNHFRSCPSHQLVVALVLRIFSKICHCRTYCCMSVPIRWYFVYDNRAAFDRSNPKHHDSLLWINKNSQFERF